MPARIIPLVTNQVYHIYNKTQGNESFFVRLPLAKLVRNMLWYYQFASVPMKFSYFRHLSVSNRKSVTTTLHTNNRNVSILSYCFMPNHFHLLVQQERDGGIIEYMSKVQNSLTRYINIKRKTKGHVFIGQYKAVRIPSDELLLHVSRYIHLNPYTGYVVKTLLETSQYPWSSYGEYISNTEGICQQTKILSHFKTKNSYCEFIENQKDYQRTLAELKGYTHSENI